jgi:hypothetical protein
MHLSIKLILKQHTSKFCTNSINVTRKITTQYSLFLSCTGWASSHRTPDNAQHNWITCTLLDYMSSRSVRAPWWWTHKRMGFSVVFDTRRSICVEMAQKASSTALRWWCTDAHSSLHTTHQELSGVLRSWLRELYKSCRLTTARPEACEMFVRRVAQRGGREGGRDSAKPVCAQSCESPVSDARFERRPQNCRRRCRVRGSIEKIRSNQVIWCHPPLTSHAVDYVPATAWHGDSPLALTANFSRAHCGRWYIHHCNLPLSGIRCESQHLSTSASDS